MSKRRKDLNKKKTRVVALISPVAYDAFLALGARNQDMTGSQIVADSLRFAFKNGLYNMDMRVGPGRPATVKPRSREQEQEEWAELYGGLVEDGSISFNKYETTPAGQVVKNARQMPLKAMPVEQAEFRKSILGVFHSIEEAEEAFKNQRGGSEPAPERILGVKK